jgi:hypothetical protein
VISRRANIAAACYLLLLGVGGALLAQEAWNSVTHYQSEYGIHADLPAGPPLTPRLVLVVLDGVRVDAAAGMPHLQALAAKGSSGVAIAELPSLSNPSRATLSTGAKPEVHGVTNNARYSPPPVDSIFSLAKKQSIPVTVHGSYFWQRAFGDSLDPARVHLFEKELGPSPDADRLVAWQEQVCSEMKPMLTSAGRGLFVIGLTATDEAAHDFGGESPEYLRLVAAADNCLGSLAQALSDEETTFVIVADHGHIQRRGQGGHGGSEPEVTATPLVLAGRGIVRSSEWQARHLDVAPTISALLGLPLPANNQGEILWQTLELSDQQRATLEAHAREQQTVLDGGMAEREGLRTDGRRSRAPLSLLAGAWFAALILGCLRKAGGEAKKLGAAAALHVALYFALYWAFGLGYSLSDIVRVEKLNWFFLRNAAAAVIALLVATRLLKIDALRTALIVTSIFGLRVAWVWYDAGLIMERVMLDLSQAFMAYMDLLHNLAVAVTGAAAAAIARRRETQRAADSWISLN